MKSTGIIRRIDDLGRVIIPKEIRRTTGLREGDPMEIFVESEKIYFVKYRPSKNHIDAIECLIGNVSEDYEFNNQADVIQKLREAIDLMKVEDDEQM